jgi:hypothetical protein
MRAWTHTSAYSYHRHESDQFNAPQALPLGQERSLTTKRKVGGSQIFRKMNIYVRVLLCLLFIERHSSVDRVV